MAKLLPLPRLPGLGLLSYLLPFPWKAAGGNGSAGAQPLSLLVIIPGDTLQPQPSCQVNAQPSPVKFMGLTFEWEFRVT